MPNANTVVADELTARGIILERAELSVVENVLEILSRVQDSLIEDLARLDPSEVADRYKAARLEKLLESTEKNIAKLYNEIKTSSSEQIVRLAKVEAKKLRASYSKAVGVDIFSIELDSARFKQIADEALILGGPSGQWWEKQAGDLQHKFTLEMQEGLARGEGLGELKKRVAGSREAGYADGIMSLARRNVESLVRSAAQSVLNQARLELYRENEEVIKGLQWRSTLDLRTSPICAALDGLLWSLDGKPQGHTKEFQRPPAHWRCRSTIIGALRSWDELARRPQLNLGDIKGKAQTVFEERLRARGFDETKISQAMMNARASLDGQVSRATTFEGWLKGRSESEQKSVLGVGRWELWNSGKVKLQDLVTKNLRPLSLDELEAL